MASVRGSSQALRAGARPSLRGRLLDRGEERRGSPQDQRQREAAYGPRGAPAGAPAAPPWGCRRPAPVIEPSDQAAWKRDMIERPAGARPRRPRRSSPRPRGRCRCRRGTARPRRPAPTPAGPGPEPGQQQPEGRADRAGPHETALADERSIRAPAEGSASTDPAAMASSSEARGSHCRARRPLTEVGDPRDQRGEEEAVEQERVPAQRLPVRLAGLADPGPPRRPLARQRRLGFLLLAIAARSVLALPTAGALIGRSSASTVVRAGTCSGVGLLLAGSGRAAGPRRPARWGCSSTASAPACGTWR